MDSLHKKPYETLVIGRYMDVSLEVDECNTTPSAKHVCLENMTTNMSNKELLSSESYTALEKNTFSGQSKVMSSLHCCEADTSQERKFRSVCEEKGAAITPVQKEISLYPHVPETFVFVCVKSQAHSQKPYLGGNLCSFFMHSVMVDYIMTMVWATQQIKSTAG